MPKAYERRASSTEAREGRIMVLKSALAFFPAVGTQFELSDGATVRATCVGAEPCTCRGPDRPHEHYWIAWPDLEARATIRITRDPDAPRFVISVEQ